MTDELPDSLFKLRLTGALRRRLEDEASKRGITLTAEILRRIDESFSDMSDRLNALEKLVFDGEKGNEALSDQLREDFRRFDGIDEELAYIREVIRRR